MKRAIGRSGASASSDRRATTDRRPGQYRDERGVSSVLAIVLLTAIVVVGTVGVVAMGAATVEETSRETELSRIELAFVELGADVDAVAVSDEGVRSIDLDLPDDGQGLVREDRSGRVVVTRYNGTTTEVVDRPIGAIVYENRDVRFAYEMGAVWRGTGKGTSMVSAPDLTYRNATLTLPITDLRGEDATTSDRLTLRKERTIAPLNSISMVRGELITVEITSEYYVGWANYFRDHVGGTTVIVDHATETVTIHLAEPVIDGGFQTGIVAAGDVYATNPSETPVTGVSTTGDVYGTIDCGGTCRTNVGSLGLEPIDATVEVRADTARRGANGSYTTLTGGETLTEGVYYVPNDTYLDGVDDLTIDLSEGDVTVVFDGNFGLKNTGLDVVNGSESGGIARVFFNHTDMAIGNGAGVAVEDRDASRLQIYGTSDMQFGMGQANKDGFTGVVYAPRKAPDGGDNRAVEDMDLDNARCGTDMCIGKGSGEVNGALVGGDVTIEQNANFTYDAGLEGVEPSVDKGAMYPPPITFLHVAVNEVEVAEGATSGK